MTASRRFLVCFGALGALLVAAGCPDPDARFAEFQERFCASPDNQGQGDCTCASDAQCSPGTACVDTHCVPGCREGSNGCEEGFACSSTTSDLGDCVPAGCVPPTMAGELDGDYFFSLTPSQSPTKPAPFIATVTTTDNCGTIEMTLDMQPISADDRVTEVGAAFTLGPYPINADGTFDGNWGTITIPPDTNPLTTSELIADVPSWRGSMCVGSPLICGTLDGTVTSPVTLPLPNTDWAMVPMDVHMEPAVINCAGDTAAPL